MADGPSLAPGHRVGHYTVLRTLGRGGMGVVVAARDERLGRDIALKMIAGPADETALARFWREARAGASINHPNVCQVFDITETPEGICLAMELLEGEALDASLARGPLAPADAARTTLAVLAALGALHARGLVHRDVKPSNVFLTPHGPKLLDFGLARPAFHSSLAADRPVGATVTDAGTLMGTPAYMSPEQLRGHDLDARSDLYAVGALLFHMLAGRQPFVGATILDVAAAALGEHPPALQGPPSVVAMDRIIRRALEKDADLRYATAADMAADLEAVRPDGSSGATVPIRALTRVVMPPLHLARPNADLVFLSSGLAEAVSASLAARRDLAVRSPAVARRWFDPGADPRRIAVDADVDLVLATTLMDSGRQVRLALQLVEGTTGAVLGAVTIAGSLDDIFALEDRLTGASLQLLASAQRARPPRATAVDAGDRPGSAPAEMPSTSRAFELFLRGLEHARDLNRTAAARDLFLAAVQEDPGFAPAWAALGRCHRVYGKYFADPEANLAEADVCFQRALELSPELPLTHRYLTHLEAEQGRAVAAIGRLLRHATVNRNDAQLFAGLVHACRYAGLIDASVAAHAEARRLDPTVDTSVDYTYVQIAENDEDVQRLLRQYRAESGPDGMMTVVALNGSFERFKKVLGRLDRTRVPPHYRLTIDAIEASLLAPPDVARAALESALATHSDPEAVFIYGLCLCKIRHDDRAIEVLSRAIRSGFAPARMLRRHHVFQHVRPLAGFAPVQEEADRRAADAAAVFEQDGGREMLGVATGADQA
jgi:non-specific serine/threonine protein kinase